MKPCLSFEGWSVDLMMDVSSVSPWGHYHLLLAVCCFAMWAELVPLRTDGSFESADWLVQELIPRFVMQRFI